MKIMSMFRNLILSMTLSIAFSAACAEGFQISQISNQYPDLAVFVSETTEKSLLNKKESTVTVALGPTPLTVKSSVPWNSENGISLVVALDVSASLGKENFKKIKDELNTFLRKLPAKSQVALIAIGSEVKTIRPFGPVSILLDGAIVDSLNADSPETALYEAVLAAQDLAAKAGLNLPLRRAVLVLTDGVDDSRRGYGREEALQKISKGDAPVFAMALAASKVTTSQQEAIKSLAQIARTSGGAFVQVTSDRVGEGLNSLLSKSLRTQIVTIDCSSCPYDGAYRAIQVGLQRPEGTTTESREFRLLAVDKPISIPIQTTPPVVVEPESNFWLWVISALLLLSLLGYGLWRKFKYSKRKTETKQIQTTTTDPESLIIVELNPENDSDEQKVLAGKVITLDISGKGRNNYRVTRDFVIGRSKAVDLHLEDDLEVSKKHAVLYIEKGILMLRDLGSANGTCLNGTNIVRPEPVHDRDLILVGRTEIRIYLE